MAEDEGARKGSITVTFIGELTSTGFCIANEASFGGMTHAKNL